MAKSQTTFSKISEEAVKAATGKGWNEWFKILDRFDVEANGHRLAAKHLSEKHKLGPWWSQAVTIRYEWERGLRTVKNQRQAMPGHSLFNQPRKKSSSRSGSLTSSKGADT
jgi:hypothetical protein